LGTNYYLHQKPDCECCGRPFKPLHIGKSSVGWCFSLHVVPEDGINTLDDWRNLWADPGAYIRNEYGERVSIADMELTITARCIDKDWDDPSWWTGFYSSEQDFHKRNYSDRGPHGLLRHCLGYSCVAHGEGTWDCIVGEFS
jgi:hypothetical protein